MSKVTNLPVSFKVSDVIYHSPHCNGDGDGKCRCCASCPCTPMKDGLCRCCRDGLECELESGVPDIEHRARRLLGLPPKLEVVRG